MAFERAGQSGRYVHSFGRLLVVALLGLLPLTRFIERLELQTQNARFRLRGPRATHSKIVLVMIDDATLEQGKWEEPMAFWGDHYAALTQQAKQAGAEWIGFDVIPNVDADDYLDRVGARVTTRPDAAFTRALDAAGGTVVLSKTRNAGPNPIVPIPMLTVQPDVAANIGFIDMSPALDEAVRDAPLYERDGQGHALPSFVALLAAHSRGVAPTDIAALQTLAGGAGETGDIATFGINYTGTTFPLIEAHRLAAGNLTPAERNLLRGAIALVGVNYQDSGDWHDTPYGATMPGTTILADALASLLDGCALKRGARAQEALMTLLLAAALMTMAARMRFGIGLVAGIGTMALWCGLAQYIFVTRHTLLPVAGPLLACAVPWLAHHTFRSIEETLQRLEIEGVFGRYVSPEIRDFLLHSPQRQQPGGQRVEASVLFLDMRGSVGFAEKRDAVEVMRELNGLFGEIVPIIDRHKGLLSKFTGDGLIAVFGVPLALENHAQAAVSTAQEIMRRIHRINAAREQTGLPEWKMGCGIHTGLLVSGSLGDSHRAEFTVIGDTVNLAARLESLNKRFQSEILISRDTFTRLQTPPEVFAGPTEVEIQGREERVFVYVIGTEEA